MLIDQLAGLTKVVEEKMKAARNHYQKMKYYIEKAFPYNNRYKMNLDLMITTAKQILTRLQHRGMS